MNRSKSGQLHPLKRCARASKYLQENRIRVTVSEAERAELFTYQDAAMLGQIVRQLAIRSILAPTCGEAVTPRPFARSARPILANVNLSGQQLDLLEKYMRDNNLQSHATTLRSLALGGVDFLCDNGQAPCADIKPDPDRQTLDPQALMVT